MQPINMESCDQSFSLEVAKRAKQNLSICYQCGNCTAGCPYGFAYDIPVSQIMRLVQMGEKEKVLTCKSIWMCASCQSCTTRCPNGIDVALIMDVLRHMAREQGHFSEKNVKKFTDAFLRSVEKNGRVHEIGLMADYIMKTGRVFTDADLAPVVLPKGKLSLRPHTIKGRKQIANIFRRFREGAHNG